MSVSASDTALNGVAIIGMNCRVPKAGNVEQFWRNLRDGVECISFFTEEELLAAGVEPSLLKNPKYVKARGLIDDPDLFDAAFFNIPPKEAEVIDPQQRIFLECAWEALEGAGYSADNYEGLIGMFAGVGPNYYIANLQANMERIESLGWYKLAIGNEKDHLTTRVSYTLDLRGPSFNVQTACSTSLVAIHLACQGLLDYQYDMALAGGCTVNVKAKGGYLYNEGLSSPDGHCRAFDAKGAGFVSGNGAGVVVLKRLADAVEDGDMIYAVIKGSAINNDGHSKAGYTAPSAEGQASVIAMAQAAAEVEPEDISYVETHGTATPLGDMIEMAALTQAFRVGTDKKGFCAIGSLKPNVGHLDTAAGVTGVIKTALALTHKQIPPSLNFEEPNPRIDFVNSPFYVNRELSEWKNGNGSPRRAGVSSFGLGGTNAHVILEEAPATAPSSASRPWQLLMLSAKTDTALERMSANLAEHLRSHSGTNLADAAFTLQLGRKTFAHRRVVVCRDGVEAVAALDRLDPQRVLTFMDEAVDRGVNFMFPGQGAQHVGMGLGLYRSEPIFREQVDAGCELLKPELGFDLRDVLYPRPADREEAANRLARIDVTQPALFVIEHALARLWMDWGVKPRAMIGYSTGEYVAACLAGVFSLKDALSLVAFRGRLMHESMPRGAMLSVPLAEEEVRARLDGSRISIAAVNGTSLCVVAGSPEDVDDFEKQLAEQGMECRRLRADHAYHSSMIEPLIGRFVERIRRVRLHAPQIPFVSNVTGAWVTAGEATDPAYWARHMRQTVRFSDGASALLNDSDAALLEVGPGQMLSGMLRRLARGGHVVVNSLPHPEEQCAEEEVLAGALGKLWLAGVRVDWRRFYARESRRRVKLPTYPFERRRYWLDLKKQSSADRPAKSHLERRADVGEWFYLPVWKQSLAPRVHETARTIDPSKCWLVFEDSCGVGRKLVERLRAGGHEVVTVEAGEKFVKLGQQTYRIDPRDPSDYAEMLADVRARGLTPDRVVHLWSLTAGERPATGRDLFAEVQAAGFYSLLYLTQTLIREGLALPPTPGATPARPLQLQVISNNVQRVTGDETLWPEKATIIGPCKTIPQEYTGISCLGIDITLPEAGTWKEAKLIDNLLAELQAAPSNSLVAYRGADRWVQAFEQVKLEAPAGRPLRLRERGVYLMTGGLGKDSLMRARYLAEELQARLVLVGRTGLPERGEWESWLEAHDEEDETSVKIKKVRELLDLGAEVLVASADVGDEAQMRSLLAQIDERFGALHGVIHAAGLTDPNASRLVLELSSVECEWQFQSKVYGLYVLEEALRGRELDFCILTSSVASIIGGVGLLAYTSANIFMDAFAHRHNQIDPVSWLSLNWQGATPEKTVDALKRILSMPPASQLVVSIQDLEARINQRIKLKFMREAEQSAEEKEASPAEREARPNMRNAYVAPSNETERKIIEIWRDLLGIDWLGIHDSFLEVGGDSLLAVQFVSRLHQTFDVKLPIRSLFETPTAAGLAVCVERLRDSTDAPTQQQAAPGAASNGNGARGSHAAVGLGGNGRVAAPTGDAATLNGSEAHASLSLVGLQTGGSRRPFFCVHPSGGNVFCFVHLARHLGNDQPFYALQSKGLNVGESPHTRVEEMAAYYLEALRVVQPSGPYLLGGWSMGGLVAFEMARQLRARGEEVGLLALLDTQAFNQHRAGEVEETSHLINFANELALSWGLEVTWKDLGLKREDLAQLKPDEQLDHVVRRAKEVGAIPADAELFEGQHLLKVFRANAGAMSRYIPQTYDGRMTLIRTDDHAREVTQDPTLGWGRVVEGGVDAHAIDASHYTMVREPFVREVARVLAACLERAREA
jgi:acyl transferase domain-containing protein/thioesterase domain-containing protein